MDSDVKNDTDAFQLEMLDFVRAAHLHGWPDGYKPTDKEGLHKFQEMRFKLGPWEYIDLFGGDTTDVGTEIVFYDQKIMWGMSYRGGIIGRAASVGEIYSFLAVALKAPNDSKVPIRGPAWYQSQDQRWLYKQAFLGEFRSFICVEQILYDGQLVYERTFSGGECGDSRYYGPGLPFYRDLFA